MGADTASNTTDHLARGKRDFQKLLYWHMLQPEVSPVISLLYWTKLVTAQRVLECRKLETFGNQQYLILTITLPFLIKFLLLLLGHHILLVSSCLCGYSLASLAGSCPVFNLQMSELLESLLFSLQSHFRQSNAHPWLPMSPVYWCLYL